MCRFHGFLSQARNTCARLKDEPTLKNIGLCTCARFIYFVIKIEYKCKYNDVCDNVEYHITRVIQFVNFEIA